MSRRVDTSSATIETRCDFRARQLITSPDADAAAAARAAVDVFCADSLESWTCDADQLSYTRLSDVPMKFARLGEDSRRLVLSLYRAILERFFVMRATGECSCRPHSFSAAGSSNLSTATFDCIASNPRRAFGGVFRDAFAYVMGKLSSQNAADVSGGVTFYPFTPHDEDVPDGIWDSLCGARTFSWVCDDGGCAWSGPMSGLIDGVEWLQDASQRICAPRLGDVPSGNRRPLLRAVADAYNAFDKSEVGIWVCRVHDCGLLCSHEPVGNFGKHYACTQYPLPFLCISGAIEPGPRFNLFALALALRILSTWNTQTVRRTSYVNVPHVVLMAKRTLGFSADGLSPDVDCAESRSFSTTVRSYSYAQARVGTYYKTGHASVTHSRWVDWGDRVLPEGEDPFYTPIPLACVNEWTSFTCSSTDSADAEATMCAVWPCFGYVCHDRDGYVSFGGSAYPANWAIREGDVAYGMVSSSVSNESPHAVDSAKGAYVKSGMDGSVLASSMASCGDVDAMHHLAKRLVCAAMVRVVCDAQSDITDDTCHSADGAGRGLVFPISQSSAFGDLGREVGNGTRQAILDGGEQFHSPFYEYFEAGRDWHIGGYTYFGLGFYHDEWGNLTYDVLESKCNGRLWLVEQWGDKIYFRYDCGCGEDDTPGSETLWHEWYTYDRRAQFGGFFGTFHFRNSAAVQAV